MQHLILTDDIGNHLQLNDYIATPVAGVTGELWMSFVNAPDAPPFKIANVVAGQKVQIPFTTDQPVRFFLVTHDAQGNKTSYDLYNAKTLDFIQNLETAVPVIIQSGAATNTTITVAVTNYTVNAKFRKIQTSTSSDFSTDLTDENENTVNTAGGLNNSFQRTRSTGLSAAKTIYIRIAHSSNGISWGEWSNVLTATFTDASGSGGSGGGTTPEPGTGLPPSGLYLISDDGMGNIVLGWTNNGATGENLIEGKVKPYNYLGQGTALAADNNLPIALIQPGNWSFRISNSSTTGYAYYSGYFSF